MDSQVSSDSFHAPVRGSLTGRMQVVILAIIMTFAFTACEWTVSSAIVHF